MESSALLNAFLATFGEEATLLVRAPGRVNLLGEHVDYNDGPVLPVAIDRRVTLAVRPTSDETVHLSALDLGQKASFRLASLGDRVDLEGRPLPRWVLYPAGVAWALRQAGYSIGGLQAVYCSDIPIGSGLSSSAAVEVGFGLAWTQLYGVKIERMELAQLCQKAENQFVGVACGLMDQFASACGVEGHALYFDTRSLEWRPVPLPAGSALVIADSGVPRSLAESGYNERRQSCEQAVALLRQYLPALRSLRDISPPEFAAYAPYLPPVVRRRAEHVVKEIARVHSAVNALHRNDIQSFGALMYSGHASLRDLYEVSTPELDALVSIARTLPGCWGARLTGAGFGGCTINLVEAASAEEFMRGLQEAYRQQTGRQAQVYLCHASAGASAEPLSN